MSKELRILLGLEKPGLYCFGEYLPPFKPAIDYFPLITPELSPIDIVGEWDQSKWVEVKQYKKDKLIHHYVWRKDKNGYLYAYDKITKKKYHDPKYKYRVYESGFIVRENKND